MPHGPNVLESQRPFLPVGQVEVETLGLQPLSLPAFVDPTDPAGTLEGKPAGTIMVVDNGKFRAMKAGDTLAGFKVKAILAQDYTTSGTSIGSIYDADPLAAPGTVLNSAISSTIPEKNAALASQIPLATGLRSGTVFWQITSSALADGAVVKDPDNNDTLLVLHGDAAGEPKKFLVL